MADPANGNSSFWEDMWTEDEPGWHLKDVNCYLQRYLSELIEKQDKRRRIFVPLCGKTIDMLWLAKQGYVVVGAELVPKAIESFFKDNNLSFTTEDVKLSSGGKAAAYRCTKEGIGVVILQCDLFSATEEALGGKFDAVWDRGSLVAINTADQTKYAALVKSLLNPWGRVLLETFQYDQSKIDGPPFSFSEQQLHLLFGDSFHIRELAMEEYEELEHPPHGRPGFAHKRQCHLMTLK